MVVPVTVAVNGCVPPVGIEAEGGEIVTATAAATVTAADADPVLSAMLVAFTT